MAHEHVAEGDFGRELQAERAAKDAAFRSEPWSPIPAQARAGFSGLAYFPPDPGWRVLAKVTQVKDAAPFEMATSTGEPRPQVRAARFDFETPSGRSALFGYKEAGRSRTHALFVPFRDATSGKETYGAGRYLDLEDPGGGEIVIDFNLAYNPYCAYSEAYSCPLPPAENWLKIRVSAGERSPPLH
ncbi:MAG TPA: DUF1684 domain-containing protein [Candidatus Thermoplasmatota archaeon]|nr:DUF1684 domain-containing protein [Candidatus Thermoplasmatota archaeon]